MLNRLFGRCKPDPKLEAVRKVAEDRRRALDDLLEQKRKEHGERQRAAFDTALRGPE